MKPIVKKKTAIHKKGKLNTDFKQSNPVIYILRSNFHKPFYKEIAIRCLFYRIAKLIQEIILLLEAFIKFFICSESPSLNASTIALPTITPSAISVIFST